MDVKQSKHPSRRGLSPWLLDLVEDPNELNNRLRDPSCREVVRQLAGELIAYCKAHRGPYRDIPRIKAGLAWAAGEAGEYEPPAGLPSQPPGGRKKTGRGRVRRRKRYAAE